MKIKKSKPKIGKNPSRGSDWVITRRDFLKASTLLVSGLSASAPLSKAFAIEGDTKLSFGLLTDSHYADTETRGIRYYRESLDKMAECVELMNNKKVDFVAELGDFKDEGNPASEIKTLKYLEAIEKVFGRFGGKRYHVLGNHDLDSISKEQFLARIENTGIVKDAKYYSFDSKGVHFAVLDANFNTDGSDYDHGNFNWKDTNVPRKQLEWLESDLSFATNPVIVFVHQQLDCDGHLCVNNAAEVRQILEKSRRVLAVFQGHNHDGHHNFINGIHYYTLKAMVDGTGEENNSYAIVTVHNDFNMSVTGYRRAVSKNFKKAR